MKSIISRLTMKKIEYRFTDKVNGYMVWLWIDKFGDEYIAQFRFGMRIKQTSDD